MAAVLIAVLFAVSSIAQGFAATGAAQNALKMSPLAAQTQAADKTMDAVGAIDAMECCGDQQMTPAACIAACAASGAIVCELAALPTIILRQTVSLGVEIAPLGRSFPPEPDPPRAVRMS